MVCVEGLAAGGAPPQTQPRPPPPPPRPSPPRPPSFLMVLRLKWRHNPTAAKYWESACRGGTDRAHDAPPLPAPR